MSDAELKGYLINSGLFAKLDFASRLLFKKTASAKSE